MGLFKKKKREEIEKTPSLAELPRLPELPRLGETSMQRGIPQLPSFPNNSIGQKFSQDSIKEAVLGEKEEEEEFEADEFAPPEPKMQMMPGPSRKPKTRELPFQEEEEMLPRKRPQRITKKAEPIFVRIDKFEESLENFERIRDRIAELEKMLREIKRVKEEEEREIDSWDKEIQSIRSQIEKIDRDIFSRIE